MKTTLGRLLILSCLSAFVLTLASLLFRVPGPPETETPVNLPPTAPELASVPNHFVSRARLRFHNHRPEPAPELVSEAQPEPMEPPEDLDECRQWAREKPELALAWMVNAPAGPQRDAVAEIVCAQIAESDPAQAVALAERYAGGCTYLLENLVYQWSERDEPAARAYALARPAGDERDRLLARVALTRAKENPYEAAILVIQETAPGDIQNEAVMSVLHQWALRDPTKALAWAQLFPEGDLRTRALKEIENILRQAGNK